MGVSPASSLLLASSSTDNLLPLAPAKATMSAMARTNASASAHNKRNPVVCNSVIDAVRSPGCPPDIVSKMVQAGYKVDVQDENGNTALHHACWEQYNHMVEVLLEYGASILGNGYLETPVHWAVKSCNVKAISSMVEKHGISILSQKDVGGFGPFVLSAQNDNPTVMEWLYLKGVSIEEQDYLGRTALHWGAYKSNTKAVHWLLSRNASIAHRDHEGMTAMHWTATRNSDKVAEMLIDVGGVLLLNSPDSEGDTPPQIAWRKQNRYLALSLYKAKLCYFLFRRPYISHDYFAILFWLFLSWNLVVVYWILADMTSFRDMATWFGILAISIVSWCVSSFSDPGWVTSKTILPQDDLILASRFDATQPVESQFAAKELSTYRYIRAPLDDKEEHLLKLEKEQSKYNYQRQILHMATEELSTADLSTYDEEVQYHELQQADEYLTSRVDAAVHQVGTTRRATLARQGLCKYLEFVDKGEWKRICIVCRSVKAMRQHHCRECGRCIDRLDHHCPWIDNCVGVGNQRSFYIFIVSLLAGVLHFYYISALGLYHELQAFSFSDLHAHGFPIRQSMIHVVLVFTLAFNLVWLGFVCALVCRHTAYMLANLTTCEVMLRPPHVLRRFPKNAKSQFWYLSDLRIFTAIRNAAMYWMQSDRYDAEDFKFEAGETETFLNIDL